MYFEELQIGARTELGAHTFLADDIKAFARKFDPQLFHVDEDAARQTHFGALCASGWQTAAVWMKLMVAAMKAESAARLARGEDVPTGGPSPGFRNMQWLKPVYAGDTIHYATEVTSLRPSESRPDWGVVESLNTGLNQHGVLVFSFTSIVFFPRKAR